MSKGNILNLNNYKVIYILRKIEKNSEIKNIDFIKKYITKT